jgi:hypothetical protein
LEATISFHLFQTHAAVTVFTRMLNFSASHVTATTIYQLMREAVIIT